MTAYDTGALPMPTLSVFNWQCRRVGTNFAIKIPENVDDWNVLSAYSQQPGSSIIRQ